MASYLSDSDAEFLLSLAQQAHGLIDDFTKLSKGECARAAELIAQLESILNRFRALRPAPTFRHGNAKFAEEHAEPPPDIESKS